MGHCHLHLKVGRNLHRIRQCLIDNMMYRALIDLPLTDFSTIAHTHTQHPKAVLDYKRMEKEKKHS